MPGIESGKTWSRIGAESEPSQVSASGIWQITEASEMIAAGKWQVPTDPVAIEKIAAISGTNAGTQTITFSAIPQTYDDLWITVGAEIHTYANQSGYYVTDISYYFNDDYSNSRDYIYSFCYGDPNPSGTIFSDRYQTAGHANPSMRSTDHWQSSDHTSNPIEIGIWGYSKTDQYKNAYSKYTNIASTGSSWIGSGQGWGQQEAASSVSTAITSVSLRTGGSPNWWSERAKVTLWGITRAGK